MIDGRAAVAMAALVLAVLLPRASFAQAEGAIAGRVLDARSGSGLPQAQVLLDDRLGAIADTAGVYRARGIRSGWHRISARMIGYRSVVQDSVFVRALPFSRSNAAGDSLIGLPNDSRLPTTLTVDLLVRRPLRLGGARSGVYLDVRNLLNRRNIVTVRRDTGQPGLTAAGVDSLAEAAYQAHPEEIPYESARYRAFADADGNGYIEGREELFPLYLSAARDFTQTLFAYGPPRLVRLGVEFLF